MNLSIWPRLAVAAAAALSLVVMAAGCAETTSSTESAGDSYPTTPIRLIVGYDAGGATDIGARMLAKELETKLDGTITVVNKPGANSQLAYTELTQSKPDGYTMAATNFPAAIITVLDKSRGASYTRDSFDPIALMVVDPTAVAVAPDSKINSPEDLIAAAKADPGKIQATTTGVASNEHFALAQLEQASGADLAPVHFADGGSAATTAFLGGNVQLLLANVSDLTPLAKAGKVKVVGVMDEKPSPLMPDVPTFTEAGYDVEISSSRGFAFPAGTPVEVRDKVSTAIGEIMQDPEFQKQMTNAGLAPSYLNATEYAKYWDETSARFEKLLPLVQKDS